MNPSIIERQPGYLLHTHPYRDSSALLEIWSRDFGRVGLVARGARRAKSPWRGLLDSFQPLLLSWGGKGDLKTLRGMELEQMITPPAGQSMAAAYYVNELVLRTCMRHDPHPGLYANYVKMLTLLSTHQQFEAQLRYFEKQLLAELGYGLDLLSDCHGEPLVADADYRYVADEGAVPVGQERDRFGEKVSGELLMALAQERLSSDQLGAAKRLMRTLLRPHLGSRPLESRRLWSIFSKLGKTKLGNAGEARH
ncbi:MAG: DNA repair protein RecO [Gammaproteobacteria bacterium]|nr:MAG: DNA repair protein RecO [Gammaproteobacteria bacterium]RLA16891.1 MAG: DNA repair protein RecO [Gammaproteobacteria bacterium]